jgi:L-lactate dehydrogenase (cytochrome)
VGGEAGVQHAISILKTEVMRDLAMLGVNSPTEVGRQHVRRLREGG